MLGDMSELDLRDPRNRSALDEKLLMHAKKSPIELAELTGLTANECMSRLAELAQSRGWMTDRMEERILIMQLDDVITDARERLQDVDDDLYAPMVRAVMQGFKQVADRFDARRAVLDTELTKIDAAYAKEMVSIVETAGVSLIDQIVESYPDVDKDWAVGMLQANVLIAARAIDARDEL